jgi:hypothetical protein
MSDDLEVAKSLLAKVRHFVTTQLDDEESAMFASLLAPGVSLAYAQDEVVGFSAGPGVGRLAGDDANDPGIEWRPNALAEALGTALRQGGVRVVGL